jgi:hypothetical protein
MIKSTRKDKCELCGRIDQYLNFHHLIPKTLHSNKKFKKEYDREFMKHHGIWICKKDCHKQIHEFISEKEMGLVYNTLDKLMEHPQVSKYLKWISKQK